MTPTSNCGCPLEDGSWGTTGWHFRYMTLSDLPKNLLAPGGIEMTQERREALERSYKGRPLAYERCPAYWGAQGRDVDPKNRTLLIDPTQKMKTSKKGSKRAIAGG